MIAGLPPNVPEIFARIRPDRTSAWDAVAPGRKR